MTSCTKIQTFSFLIFSDASLTVRIHGYTGISVSWCCILILLSAEDTKKKGIENYQIKYDIK